MAFSSTTIIFSIVIVLTFLNVVYGCSNFYLNDDTFKISGRTMDLSNGISFRIVTRPVGTMVSSKQNAGGMEFESIYGVLAFEPKKFPVVSDDQFVTGGLNTEGLTCDQQTLIDTIYPDKSKNTSSDLSVNLFCNYVLALHGTTNEVVNSLKMINVWSGEVPMGGSHFSIRDSTGQSIVVEFIEKEVQIYNSTDINIMTNEPPYAWHMENIRHYKWKKSLIRNAISTPGNFYPDERFVRLFMVREGFEKPKVYEEAMQQAWHLLDTVTVPMGKQRGTDTGKGGGEGSQGGDHTHYGVIYDHKNGIVYWRTKTNHQLQRVVLKDMGLEKGNRTMELDLNDPNNEIPYFNDASSYFH
jgi:choloylglycine hydrolase